MISGRKLISGGGTISGGRRITGGRGTISTRSAGEEKKLMDAPAPLIRPDWEDSGELRMDSEDAVVGELEADLAMSA